MFEPTLIIAAASLVFGGVMDAFPKLDVMLPHAGGTFPWLIGRMDQWLMDQRKGRRTQEVYRSALLHAVQSGWIARGAVAL